MRFQGLTLLVSSCFVTQGYAGGRTGYSGSSSSSGYGGAYGGNSAGNWGSSYGTGGGNYGNYTQEPLPGLVRCTHGAVWRVCIAHGGRHTGGCAGAYGLPLRYPGSCPRPGTDPHQSAGSHAAVSTSMHTQGVVVEARGRSRDAATYSPHQPPRRPPAPTTTPTASTVNKSHPPHPPPQDDLIKELEKEYTAWVRERATKTGPGGRPKTLAEELEDLGGVSSGGREGQAGKGGGGGLKGRVEY